MSKWAESPYKFASFFGPQPGPAADLVIFKVENAAGCGRAAGGWRVCAGPPTNCSQHFKAARQWAVSSGWVHAGPPTKNLIKTQLKLNQDLTKIN